MFQFLEWAQMFIDALSPIGDFLLFTPFNGADNIEKYGWMLSGTAKLRLMADMDAYANVSVGGILFSGALVSLLTFKIVKFFIGIVTGS